MIRPLLRLRQAGSSERKSLSEFSTGLEYAFQILSRAKALKGKYRNRIKEPWVKLEEMAEKLVREGKR